MSDENRPPSIGNLLIDTLARLQNRSARFVNQHPEVEGFLYELDDRLSTLETGLVKFAGKVIKRVNEVPSELHAFGRLLGEGLRDRNNQVALIFTLLTYAGSQLVLNRQFEDIVPLNLLMAVGTVGTMAIPLVRERITNPSYYSDNLAVLLRTSLPMVAMVASMIST